MMAATLTSQVPGWDEMALRWRPGDFVLHLPANAKDMAVHNPKLLAGVVD
jgi:hypothetical protein